MPDVQVVVDPSISSEQRENLNRLIREEVCKAAKRLGEGEKIPDTLTKFSLIIGEGDRRAGVTVEISMMLFPREPVKRDIYELALKEAAHRIGVDDVSARVLSAYPNNWYGPMWDFK